MDGLIDGWIDGSMYGWIGTEREKENYREKITERYYTILSIFDICCGNAVPVSTNYL